MIYHVFDDGQIVHGDAKTILAGIHSRASTTNSEIADMSLKKYAKSLIDDAPYFLEKSLMSALDQQKFESDYDHALQCLNLMPNSRVRILATAPGPDDKVRRRSAG
jgi:hypothetical protein